MEIPIRILIYTGDTGGTWETLDVFWEASDFNWSTDLGGGTGTSSPDTFTDESLTFKQALKDLSDPGKLFTDYSRSFTVPASKTNNKIFKHYYNIDITNGLDVRSLISARLEMGSSTYREGNILVEGVKMNNGVPRAYKLRFYGKLSELQKYLGSDKLSDLNFSNISSWDWYTEFTDTTDRDIIVPLSCRSDRFVYDSGTANTLINDTRNIAYVQSAYTENYSLREEDLVPAIKVGAVLDQIESDYGFTFAGALSQDYIRDLYLYLHKVNKKDDAISYTGYVTSFSYTTLPANTTIINNVSYLTCNPVNTTYQIRAKAVLTTNETLYIKKDGQTIIQTGASNAFSSWTVLTAGDITAEVKSTTSSGSSLVTVEIEEFNNLGVSNGVDQWTDTVTIGSGDTFVVSDNMPNTTITQFLGTLIKFFNLVLEVDDNLSINSYHYDAYMAAGTTYDITKYVIIENYDVDRPNLYTSIKFALEENDSAINYGYAKFNNKRYGELEYEVTNEEGSKLFGEQYEVKMDATLIPPERLTDLDLLTLTDVGYTLFAATDGEELQTKSCFTYVTTLNDSIAFYNGTTVDNATTVFRPQNSWQHTVGLHFSEELFTYDPDYNHVGMSLWSLFYRGITSQSFDETSRRVSINAYLTPGLVENIKMNDSLRISNNLYRIQTMETNHQTGRTRFELILVGDIDIDDFTYYTTNIANDSGSETLLVVYINSSGYPDLLTIAPSGNSNVTYLGDLKSFSHDDYTLS